ncbi:hypothetical protein [Microbacterium sp.]|uniref:hypothetical protein n=1 Tax=Microbacterium sp. TaxID=51671 RepID=UPI0033420630
MVALLVGLRWRQLGHQLARNPWMIVTLVFGGLGAAGLLTALTFGLSAMRIAAPGLAPTVLVLAGSVIVLGWWVGSLLVSVDDSLSPERFALLPVGARTLLPGFVVAGATTIGGIGTTLALLLMLIGWSADLGAVIAALVMVPVGLAVCVLGARVISGVLARWLARRRTRDLVLSLGVLLVACSGLFVNLALNAVTGISAAGPVLEGVAQVVAWTPVGAVFGVPAALAQGAPLVALLRLLITLATVALLWAAAYALLAAQLVSPVQGSGGGRVRSGGLLDRIMPATPAGAIAARTVRYSRRDPRHTINIVMLLLLPALLIGVMVMNEMRRDGAVAFSAGVVLIPSIIALLVGSIIQMELAYDNDALALHVLTGVRGTADRAGRLLGLGVIVVPVMIVLCLASALLAGRADLIPASLGAAIGLSASAAGAGSWLGVYLPGRAPAPEANPFGRGSGGNAQSLVAMLAMMPIAGIAGAPAFGFAIAALWIPPLGWVSLACGVLIGGAVAWGGVLLGGRALDKRWPEVLADVASES